MHHCPVTSDTARYYAELDRIDYTAALVERLKQEYLLSHSGRNSLLEDDDVHGVMHMLILCMFDARLAEGLDGTMEKLRLAVDAAAERLAKRDEERERETALALALEARASRCEEWA